MIGVLRSSMLSEELSLQWKCLNSMIFSFSNDEHSLILLSEIIDKSESSWRGQAC